MYVSKPMCSCQLDQFHGVDMCCQVWTLCKAFRKWNCFGDDAVAEQPSHPCLGVRDTVCHITPCVFLSESWLKQCVLVSMIVASTHVPHSKTSQIHSPLVVIILSLDSIWRLSVTGDFQTQCHLW